MATKSYIGQVTIGSDTSPVGSTLFGICGTAAATADKTVKTGNSGDSGVLTAFDNLATGVTIHVKFTNGNTATAPTLSVGTMNTKPLIKNPNGTLFFAQNSIISLTYDGTDWVVNASQATPGTVEQTYDSSSSNSISGAGVANAFTTLVDTLTGSPGSGKTITAFDQVDGKVSATFGNISITKSQVSDFSHTHGNITNDGKLSNTDASIANNDQLVIIDATDNSGRIAKASLKFNGSTTTTALTPKGTWESFVKSVTITQGDGITVSDSGTAITGTGSRTISIGTGAVTNTMLEHSTITIGTQEKALGESFTLSTLVTDLGLSSAMKYKGGVATLPTATDSTTFNTYNAGDVVTITGTTNKGKEYVYNKAATAANSTWVELGDESSFKVKQTAVSSPTVPSSGTTTATAFIDTISQNENGIITATKKNVNFPVTSVATLTGAITAANLKSQLSLNNVTNDAQIAKSIGTTKGDIIYFDGAADPERLGIGSAGQVLTVSSSGIPSWAANQATDEKVKQSPYNTTASSSTKFNLLFKHSTGDTEETNGVYFSTISGKELTWDAYTGTLTATKFSGNGSGLTGITTDHISGTGNGTKYLRQDGWKTLSISYDDASDGKVITGFTFSGGTLPTYSQGTKASASVSNGVLTIVNQGTDSFTQGSVATLTNILRTNVAISAS